MADIEGRSSDIVLNGRFRLVPDGPLPHLNSPTAKAYLAVDPRERGRSFFCLVCDPVVPPRRPLIQRLRADPEPGYLGPIDDGMCEWPLFGGRRTLAIVFEQPAGKRLEPDLSLSPGDLLRRVVLPIADSLRSLEKRGVTHRAIRPDNLFWSGPTQESVVLGECVTAPPGYGQPVAYETAENAIAHPVGRSSGTTKDDLYALGVLMLALLRGAAPAEDLDDEAVILRKLDYGTFSTLGGGMAVSSELAPAIRALLADDYDQRWNVDTLCAWLRNQRTAQTRGAAPLQAARSFEFEGRHYETMRGLAFGFGQQPAAAVEQISNGAVEQWLRNSAGAEQRAEAVEALRGSQGRFDRTNAHAVSTLVARVCLLLDPEGPFRFGTAAVMPEGLGTALYHFAASGKSVDDIAGLLRAQIPAWLPAERAKWLPGFQGWIDRMYVHLKDSGLGAGIDRCLYEMNPDLPCLGEKVRNAGATTLDALLGALEESARNADFELSPIESHVTAFALTHLAACRLPLRPEIMDQGRNGDRPLFELGLLSGVQRAAGNRPAPNLCRSIIHRISPRIARLHHRPLREALSEQLDKRQEDGSLEGLLHIVGNTRMWQDDARGLAEARLRHRQAAEALVALQASRSPALEAALVNGREMAVALSLSAGLALAMIGLVVQGAG